MLLDTDSDTKQRIYNFLKITPIGVLSTVTPDNDPHGTVVYYGINQQFNVSILTKSGTRKYDNLIHNPHVMLTIFEPLTQTTVQITGVAAEVTDQHKITEIMQMNIAASMQTSEGGVPAITKLEAGNFVAFEIQPLLVRMAVYERPDPGEYGDLFETVSNFEIKDF